VRNIDVVIVGGSVNSLGILRSLAPHARCLVLSDTKSHPVFKSRFGNKKLVKNTKSIDIIDELERLGKLFVEPPVLFLSEEKTVEQVSLHRERLHPYYKFELAEHTQVIELQSKSGFQQLAEDHDAPIPQAMSIEKVDDLEQVDHLTFPCVFKPLYQDSGYSKRFKKAYKVGNLAEVRALYKEIQPTMPGMMLQEWIHGADNDIYFCLAYFDKKSRLIGDFTGRKLRSWPLNIGGTASCTNAPEQHDELSRITANFAKVINYSGLMGMEYKFDSQRQAFYMIEPTVGRTDYQHEIATLSGSNLLKLIYCYLNKSDTSKPTPMMKPIIWRDEIADANALAHGGNPDEPVDAKSYGAIRRLNDPWPYLSALFKRIKTKVVV
jgi:predicted ATP-grasp superfamily ATP-dependent carboligase